MDRYHIYTRTYLTYIHTHTYIHMQMQGSCEGRRHGVEADASVEDGAAQAAMRLPAVGSALSRQSSSGDLVASAGTGVTPTSRNKKSHSPRRTEPTEAGRELAALVRGLRAVHVCLLLYIALRVAVCR